MKPFKKLFLSAAVTTLLGATMATAMESDTPIASLKTAPERMKSEQVLPKKFPGTNTILQGAMVYNDLWGEMNPDGSYTYPITSGIYSIQAREGGKVQNVQQLYDLLYMKSGLCLNGVYYVFSSQGQDARYYMSQYSTSNWSRTSKQEIDFLDFPVDLTYDPVTKKTYGFFYNDETQEFSRFCSYSTYYGTPTEIRNDMDRNCFAIAANKEGELYGIWGYTGWLIKINPRTGEYVQIGTTGVYPGDLQDDGYINSLTFDDSTGKLYWAANDENGHSALYEINLETGKATKIMDFENNASFAGIYALPYSVSGDAPAEVTDIDVNFDSFDSTEGTLSFTMPLLTVNAQPLTGTVGALIEMGGVKKDIENLSPGQKVSCILNFPEGVSTGTITPYTDDEPGAAVTFTAFAGEDTPGAPKNLILADMNGRPSLSWSAPSKGAHGGNYDTANLKYRIVRNNTNTEVARDLTETSWTDSSFSGTAALSYSVYAYTSKGESEPAVSEKIVFGEGYSIPFTCGFDSADDFDLWTVVDLNGNSKWEYDKTKKYIYSKYDDKGPADDWIFSPKFHAEAGKVYQLDLDASVLQNSNPKYAENFEVWLSTSASPEGKAVEIVSCKGFLSKDVKRTTAFFRAPADGWYHLGIYTDSPATHWQLNIDNVGVSEVDSHVPGPVTDLIALPGENGELSATVSFVLPLTDTENRELTEKMTVAVYNDESNTPAYTAENLNPGDPVSWTDTRAKSGQVTYKVAASTVAGKGEEKSVSVFVGTDAPGAPTALTAVQQVDGSVLLSWEAPQKGANGGWFDAAQLSYRIVRSDGEILSSDCKGNSYTDATLHLTKQELLYYLVTPYCGDTKGASSYTDFDLFGPAYKAPLAETFPNADMKWYPWISESDGPVHVWCLETAGVNPTTSDQNGDSGLAMFVSNEGNKGITGTFTSPKIDISALTAPEVSFRMYHSSASEEANEAIDVYLISEGGERIKLTDSPLLRDNGSEGWQRHSFSLADAPTSVVRIQFSAKSLGAGNVHIDNVTFDNELQADLEVVSIASPSRAATGVDVPLTAVVANNGNTELNAIITLLADGTEAATADLSGLKAGETVKIPFSHNFATIGKHTLTVSGTARSDSNPANDSAECKIEVVDPVVPTVDGLTARTEDNSVVTLEWLPAYSHGGVTDDIESYNDWAIDGIGDWIMVDLDRDVTYNINKDLETYPYQNDPKAFQVCNAKSLGIDIWTQGTPKSGNKMLMAIANINIANDDWLISPLLNGNAQTVSFHAKAFTTDGVNPEKMIVYYSTGSTNPDDFTKVSAGESITLDESWNEYSFRLPEGARRFAVRCVSNDAFALFIDDLCFSDMTVPCTTVERYEIYRNNEKIGETTDRTFTDNLSEAGLITADYHIKAYYANGMTAQSEKFTVMTSEISNVMLGSINVSASKEMLTITGAAGSAIEIISADGKVISLIGKASDKENVAVSAGVYLVRINNTTVKVIVE